MKNNAGRWWLLSLCVILRGVFYAVSLCTKRELGTTRQLLKPPAPRHTHTHTHEGARRKSGERGREPFGGNYCGNIVNCAAFRPWESRHTTGTSGHATPSAARWGLVAFLKGGPGRGGAASDALWPQCIWGAIRADQQTLNTAKLRENMSKVGLFFFLSFFFGGWGLGGGMG